MQSKRSSKFLGVTVAASICLSLHASSVLASHKQPDFFGGDARCINGRFLHWNNPKQNFQFSKVLNSEGEVLAFSPAFKARVRDGVAAWNGLGTTLQWTEVVTAARDLYFPSYDGPGGVLGVTSTRFLCDERRLVDADLVFDRDEDWYTGTGDAGNGIVGCFPVDCPIDAWSIATHEFGHMSGLGHYYLHDHEAVCANDPTQHSMCRKYERGTERQRSPEQHDVAAIRAIY